MLGTKTDRAGRALVDPFLKVVDAPEVFVVGDAASVMQNEHPVPGVAQAAIQEGRYVGRLIEKELKGRKVERPFRYFDKGNMAVIGKNYAVLERDWLHWCGRSSTSFPCRNCRTGCACNASGSGHISPASAARASSPSRAL